MDDDYPTQADDGDHIQNYVNMQKKKGTKKSGNVCVNILDPLLPTYLFLFRTEGLFYWMDWKSERKSFNHSFPLRTSQKAHLVPSVAPMSMSDFDVFPA